VGGAAGVVGAPKSKTSSSTTIGGFATGIAGGRPGTLGGVAGAAGVLGAPNSNSPSSTVTAGFGDGIAGGVAPGLVGICGGAAAGTVGCWTPASSVPRLIEAVISTITDVVGLFSGIGSGLVGIVGVFGVFGVLGLLSATSSRRPSGPVPGRQSRDLQEPWTNAPPKTASAPRTATESSTLLRPTMLSFTRSIRA
jgi:hypothetical protein